LAESYAQRKIPMTVNDWAKRFELFLSADDLEVQRKASKIAAEIAKDEAESEFEKWGLTQGPLFRSDYDCFVELEELAADGGKGGADDDG
jgi:hypothetical protein